MRKIRLAIVLGLGMAVAGLTNEPSHGAGLLVADGPFGGALEIKEQNVKVVINNGVAVTNVEQIFVNTEDRIVEALYTFPVPKQASISNFSMWINGKEMFGEVVERQRARQIYESYKQTRRDPGLLEQVDYKTFEMRIFPIGARAEQRIKLTYYQQLDFDHDWANYVYPLATSTRQKIDQRTTGTFSFALDVKSEVPIVSLQSPSHADDFVTVPHSENYYHASLETDGGDLSRDLVLAYKTVRPHTGIDVITSQQPDDDGYLMLTLTAGEELAELSRGMDYVFVLDVSGSMANDGKLRRSRNSVFAFVDSLSGEDRFEVISFNAATQPLFGGLQAVTDERRDESRRFLDDQRARGGTDLRPAISAAYRYQDSDRVLNVVILSDGLTEQQEQRGLLQLIGERPSGSRVFCIGVGNEVNRPLLRQLADDAGGLAAFLSDDDDLERQAQAFRRKLMRPAMRNLQIEFSGVDTYDVEPQELPNLFHGSPLRLYGRYRKSGNATVTIRGEVQGAPIEQTIDIRLPKLDSANPEIERMWAWHRVQRLQEDQREAGNAEAHKDEIVRLCEGYSIVSQYASFIVLENDGEYDRWKIDRRNAVRIARDRAAQQQVREQLTRLRQLEIARLEPQNEPTVATPAAASPDRSVDLDQRRIATRRDISLPAFSDDGGGGGGGGAMDPVSCLIALGLGGAAAAGAHRRKKKPLTS